MKRSSSSSASVRFAPAQQARAAAGFDVRRAARALGLSERRWREIERNGGASMKVAERAGRLFRCSGSLFLFSPQYHAAVDAGASEQATARSQSTGGADTGLRSATTVATTTAVNTTSARAARRSSSRSLRLVP